VDASVDGSDSDAGADGGSGSGPAGSSGGCGCYLVSGADGGATQASIALASVALLLVRRRRR
jgi:hypothetical protein